MCHLFLHLCAHRGLVLSRQHEGSVPPGSPGGATRCENQLHRQQDGKAAGGETHWYETSWLSPELFGSHCCKKSIRFPLQSLCDSNFNSFPFFFTFYAPNTFELLSGALAQNWLFILNSHAHIHIRTHTLCNSLYKDNPEPDVRCIAMGLMWQPLAAVYCKHVALWSNARGKDGGMSLLLFHFRSLLMLVTAKVC